MCLFLIANRVNSRYKLIIAANRDEFYDRPAKKAEFWKEYPYLLAGQDLKAGGTWLGITTRGKFAAVTNYRSGFNQNPDALSRGDLTLNFLISEISAKVYLEKIKNEAPRYNKFNLIFGTTKEIYYYSSVSDEVKKLDTGIFGLSNCLLDTPWPKVTSSKANMQKIITQEAENSLILELLEDKNIYPDDLLPDTGIGIELERVLSAVFIKTPVYGTRAATVIKITHDNEVQFLEKSFDDAGNSTSAEYSFMIK